LEPAVFFNEKQLFYKCICIRYVFVLTRFAICI